MTLRRLAFTTAICAASLIGAGCSSSGGEKGRESCPEGTERNPFSGECRELRDSTPRDPRDTSDTSPSTGSPDAADDSDARPDRDTSPEVDGSEVGTDGADAMACDSDGDGFRDTSCGGPDCDGENPGVHPEAPELCDRTDNDCDGENNEGIDCTFFAHSRSKLYEIDPFEPSIRERNASNAPAAAFLDMDTHPDGDLWAVAGDTLYRLPNGENAWRTEGTVQSGFGTNFNGMAIDRRGTAYLTGGDTLSTLDLNETGGSLDATTVGDMDGGFSSSGDCVINKKGSLLMTSSDPSGGTNDVLVLLDGATADATEVGATDHADIWGLTAAWGKLFGVTDTGKLIKIDPSNGSSRVVTTFQNVSFYGSASTPASRRERMN